MKMKNRKKRLAFALLFLMSGTTWFACPVSSLAATYKVGSLSVSTFSRNANYNGSYVRIVPSDIIRLSGGTLQITGGENAYTALLGTGSGSNAGFSWGTGGTIDTSSNVVLNINVPAQDMQSLTQKGSGTINLSGTGSQKLRLTQNSGTLNVAGDLVSAGNVTISGITNVVKECSVNNLSCQENWLKVDGTLTTGSTFHGNVSNISVLTGGVIDTYNAHIYDGALSVAARGKFLSEKAAAFYSGTTITNAGIIELGDNSKIQSERVTNNTGGFFQVGNCTNFFNQCESSIVYNKGTFVAEGNVGFDTLYNGSDFTAEGNVVVRDDLTCYSFTDSEHVHHTGRMTIAGSGTFCGTTNVKDGAEITIAGSGTFCGTTNVKDGAEIAIAGTGCLNGNLTVEEHSSFTTGGSLTSSSDILITDSTLASGGNITTCGALTTTGNSTLGLTNRLLDPSLGNLTAWSGIDLASTTNIVTDLSGLNAVRQPTLLVHMVAGDSTGDFKIDGNTTNVTDVAKLFGSGTVLRQIYATDNGGGYDIYAKTRLVEDYAKEEGLDPPAVDVGGALDDLIAITDPTDPAYDMAEELLAETDKEAVNRTLYNMAGGYGVENVFSMTLINLGQAGSPFFFGRVAGLPQKKANCQCSQCGKVSDSAGTTEYWGTPIYQTFHSNGNSYQHGFDVHEAGLIVGVRKHYTESTSAGLLFSYGAPQLRQSGSLNGYNANYNSDLDMDDYQYAAHFEHQTANDFRFSFFVGGGSQTLNVDRNAWGTSSNDITMNRTLSGSTKGNNLSVTAYLSRPVCLTDRLTLSPVIGFDSMHAWLYGFSESASGTGNWQDMSNLSEGHFYSPVSYKKADYHRNMARVGLWLDHCGSNGGFSGQIFYGTQLGGDSYAIVPVSTLGGSYNGSVHGYDIGRDSLNLGGGLWRYLDTERTITVSANYNYFTLQDVKASNISAAIAWRH